MRYEVRFELRRKWKRIEFAGGVSSCIWAIFCLLGLILYLELKNLAYDVNSLFLPDDNVGLEYVRWEYVRIQLRFGFILNKNFILIITVLLLSILTRLSSLFILIFRSNIPYF